MGGINMSNVVCGGRGRWIGSGDVCGGGGGSGGVCGGCGCGWTRLGG